LINQKITEQGKNTKIAWVDVDDGEHC